MRNPTEEVVSVSRCNGYFLEINSAIAILESINDNELQSYILAESDANDMLINAKNEGLEIGLTQGREEGAYQKAIETARNLLKMGLTLEQVSQGTGLSSEEIEEIMASLN